MYLKSTLALKTSLKRPPLYDQKTNTVTSVYFEGENWQMSWN